MRVARRILFFVLAAVLVVAVLGLGLRIYMGRGAEDALLPGEAVSIAGLRSPLPAASYLACPLQYCSAPAAFVSPVFDLPWDRLYEYWAEVISGERRMLNVVTGPEARRLVYIQRSPIFRFPDIITVEFVPLGPERSSIAIFSRSRYGDFDFRKNRKQVQRWLILLEKMARPHTAH